VVALFFVKVQVVIVGELSSLYIPPPYSALLPEKVQFVMVGEDR